MYKIIIFIFLVIGTSDRIFASRTIDISGFLTAAASRTDVSETFYYRNRINNKINYIEDSLVGVNFSSKLSENFLAMVQLLYKKTIDKNNYYPEVEMAFLRYRLARGFFIKAGKIKLPIWMISDHRNIGFLYPWTIPPEELYEQAPLEEVTGVHLAYSFPISSVRLGLQALYGQGYSGVHLLNNYHIPAMSIVLDYKFFGRTYVKHLNLNLGIKTFKFKASYTRLDKSSGEAYDQVDFYNQATGQSASVRKDYQASDFYYDYYSIGVKGNIKKLEVLSELGQANFVKDDQKLVTSINEYITFSYKLGFITPHFTFLYGKNSIKDSDKLQANQFFDLFPAPPPYELKITSYTLGLNFLITSTTNIKLQAKKIHLRGSAPNSFLFSSSYEDKHHFGLYSIALNAIF